MTSANYYIRWGMWNAPCHHDPELAGCVLHHDTKRIIPPILVTAPAVVENVSAGMIQVDTSVAHVIEWLNTNYNKKCLFPSGAIFQTGPACTTLDKTYTPTETQVEVGDVVRVRYRPMFNTLPCGDTVCNLVATDILHCNL